MTLEMQTTLINFSVNTSLDELAMVRTTISEQLVKFPLTEIEINQIVLSVDEICANLVLHAEKKKLADSIEISLIKEENGIRVNILDHCISYNPITNKENNIDSLIKERKKGGIGLILVNRIMDNIEYRIEETYNICSLFKRMKFEVA